MDSLPSRSYDAAARQATGARNGRTRPANLREQIDPVVCKAYDDATRAAVCMFPTPTAQETKSERRMGGAEYIYTDCTGKPRRKTKGGSASFGLGKMAVTGLWPTYTMPHPHDSENTAGKYMSRQNQSDLAAAVSLHATPTQRCHKTESNTETREGSVDLQTQIGGQLNPDWVDWLVGLPSGYTDIEKDMPSPHFDEHHFGAEPEGVPRVAIGTKNRVPRLMGVGNIAVPQQFYPIFAAIADIEKTKG